MKNNDNENPYEKKRFAARNLILVLLIVVACVVVYQLFGYDAFFYSFIIGLGSIVLVKSMVFLIHFFLIDQ